MVASAFVKCSSLLTLFVSIPLTITYLGPQRYGIWVAVTGAMGLMSFSDLGLGLGLLNAVATAAGREDRGAIASAVSNTFCLLCTLALICGFGLTVLIIAVPWGHFLHADQIQQDELRLALFCLAGCFIFNLPFTVVQKVQFGLQQGYQSSCWQVVGTLGSVLLLVLAVRFRGDIHVLILAVSGFPALVCSINFSTFFFVNREIRPQRNLIDWRAASQAIRTGFSFLFLTSGYQLAFALDGLLFVNAAGGTEFARYSVCARVFGVLPGLIAMSFVPFWPAFAEAASRGDNAWIRHTHRRIIQRAAVGAVVLGVPLVLVGNKLIALLTHNSAPASLQLLLGCFLWSVAEAIKCTVGPMMNGLNLIKFESWVFFIYAVLSAPVQWIAARWGGAEGFAWASAAVSIALVSLPLSLRLSWHIRSMGTGK